jgi:release factor glutamine methyltransferase
MNDTLKALTQEIKNHLSGIYNDRELRQVILSLYNKGLGLSATQVLAVPDAKVSISDYNQIIGWVKRLQNNEPLQYVLGETEFYGLTFYVGPGVLIPRPETEELVQLILKANQKVNAPILDIGTGSGCIAIALAKNLPEAHMDAMDISAQALAIADENARLNGVLINFILHDVLHENGFQPSGKYDIIVSNPPYVTESEKKWMQPNVLDFEPESALFVSDTDPLIFYRQISQLATKWLAPGGWLYFEINEQFGNQMYKLLENIGYSQIIIHKDINQKDRMAQAQWNKQ